jgi:hypothetical protein
MLDRALAAALAHRGCQVGVAEDAADCLRHCRRVVHGDKQTSLTIGDDLGDAAAVGGDDGFAGGHRLHDDLAEWLARDRGVHQQIQLRDKGGNITAKAGEFGDGGDAEGFGEAVQFGFIFHFAKQGGADDLEGRAANALPYLSGGLEEDVLSLPFREAADDSDTGRACGIARSGG